MLLTFVLILWTLLSFGLSLQPWLRMKMLKNLLEMPTRGGRKGTRRADAPRPQAKAGTACRYRLTMGLRSARMKRWLAFDENYVPEHGIKQGIMEKEQGNVLGALPESQDACEEAMDAVVEDLTSNYPESFERYKTSAADEFVQIVETGETVQIHGPGRTMSPLRIASFLAMEDFNIIRKDDRGEHVL